MFLAWLLNLTNLTFFPWHSLLHVLAVLSGPSTKHLDFFKTFFDLSFFFPILIEYICTYLETFFFKAYCPNYVLTLFCHCIHRPNIFEFCIFGRKKLANVPNFYSLITYLTFFIKYLTFLYWLFQNIFQPNIYFIFFLHDIHWSKIFWPHYLTYIFHDTFHRTFSSNIFRPIILSLVVIYNHISFSPF